MNYRLTIFLTTIIIILYWGPPNYAYNCSYPPWIIQAPPSRGYDFWKHHAEWNVMFFFRFINGIIEFDEKLSIYLSAISVCQCSPSKTNWNIILTSLFIYFFGFVAYRTYMWPPLYVDITSILSYIFGVPYITDFAIIISVCFYLSNLANRFQTLNDLWERLPDGLIPTNQWTYSDILISVDNIRLLHAQLSELVKTFSLGYGILLLGFFVFIFIDTMYMFYLGVNHEFVTTNISLIKNITKNLPIHILNVQCITFMMSIIVAASWINEKVHFIIFYFIFYFIILQVKLFFTWMYKICICIWFRITFNTEHG